jgi:uncharacterized membrane protein YphA (DoxX/SURF4 family)
MKIAIIIIRVLLGLLFLFGSVSYFLHLFPVPEMQGKVKTFNEGLAASGYIFPLVKALELLCGIAFVSGFFVPLATVVIFPIVVNIFLFHALVDTTGVPVAVFVLFANLFLAYSNKEKYAPLFSAK